MSGSSVRGRPEEKTVVTRQKGNLVVHGMTKLSLETAGYYVRANLIPQASSDPVSTVADWLGGSGADSTLKRNRGRKWHRKGWFGRLVVAPSNPEPGALRCTDAILPWRTVRF
jgi:hypothetical protein